MDVMLTLNELESYTCIFGLMLHVNVLS